MLCTGYYPLLPCRATLLFKNFKIPFSPFKSMSISGTKHRSTSPTKSKNSKSFRCPDKWEESTNFEERYSVVKFQSSWLVYDIARYDDYSEWLVSRKSDSIMLNSKDYSVPVWLRSESLWRFWHSVFLELIINPLHYAANLFAIHVLHSIR